MFTEYSLSFSETSKVGEKLAISLELSQLSKMNQRLDSFPFEGLKWIRIVRIPNF